MEMQRVWCCYFRIRMHFDSAYIDFIQHKTAPFSVMLNDLSPAWRQVSLLAVEPIIVARSLRKKIDEQKHNKSPDITCQP